MVRRGRRVELPSYSTDSQLLTEDGIPTVDQLMKLTIGADEFSTVIGAENTRLPAASDKAKYGHQARIRGQRRNYFNVNRADGEASEQEAPSLLRPAVNVDIEWSKVNHADVGKWMLAVTESFGRKVCHFGLKLFRCEAEANYAGAFNAMKSGAQTKYPETLAHDGTQIFDTLVVVRVMYNY